MPQVRSSFFVAGLQPRSLLFTHHDFLDVTLLTVLFIGLDDHLHEFVTHDIFVSEIDKLNPLDVCEYSFSLNQTTAFASRQVNLGHVSGNNCLRTETDPGEKHLHLFASRVLGFIKNDECVRQCAASHKGQGRNFNDAFFQKACHAFVVDEVKQCVVEWTQIWVDLVL